MQRLNHFLLIPDGNRRYAKREHLAAILSEQGNLASLSLPNEVTLQLEERIGRFVQTGRDPFYDEESMVDYLKDLDTEAHFLARAYKKGASNIDATVRHVLYHSLASTISIYGLQLANLQRKEEEISAMLQAEIEQFDKWSEDSRLVADVRFTFVGDLFVLWNHPKGQLYLQAARKLQEQSNKQKPKLYVYILAPYTEEWEINQGIRNWAFGKSTAEIMQAIDEGRIFNNSMLIAPPVDLVIRASNEKRTSEAIPIQVKNAEYVFRRQYFPDFGLPLFEGAIAEFYQRQRSFGR